MWRTKLGIEIGLENVEFQIKLDREKAGDYQISRGGWIGDYMDPITLLDLWWSDSSFNDVNYNNPEYDKRILESKTLMDQKVRMENMKEAEKNAYGRYGSNPSVFLYSTICYKTRSKGHN